MDKSLAYRVMRTLNATHHLNRSLMQLRYENVSTITAEAIRSAAKAALNKSTLTRQLDLKTKYGKGSPTDAKQERAILERIADGDDLDSAMSELITFYKSLQGGAEH